MTEHNLDIAPVASSPADTTVAQSEFLLTVAELCELTGASQERLVADLATDEQPKPPFARATLAPGLVRQFLARQGVDFRFRVIAHVNLKGGVGKTTSTVSLATRAAQYGFKTCVLDLDSQGSASLAFGIVAEDDDPVFIDVWQQPDALLPESVREIQEGLSILPSSLENALLDMSLASPVNQKQAVRDACAVLQRQGFDLVLIDCPPSLGAAVISTACAADTIVVPVGFDAFSRKGLELTIQEIGSICDTFGLPTPSIKILYNFFDRRVKQSVEIWGNLNETYGAQMIPTPIRTTTQFTRATNSKTTVFSSAGRSKSKEDYDLCLRNLLGIDIFRAINPTDSQ